MFYEGTVTARNKLITLQKKLSGRAYNERCWGCAVFDFAMVASGKADGGIVLNTNSWDIAAGGLLVNEAGGKVTGLHTTTWNHEDANVLVSNGRLHNVFKRYTSSVK